MNNIIYFIVTFIIIYIISYFMLVRKKDKYDKNKIPVEVAYMVKKHNLNLKDINYKKFLKNIALIGSLDMTIAIIIIFPISNIYLQLIAGFIVLIPLVIISFGILAKYYKKKGYEKNERKNTRNRK